MQGIHRRSDDHCYASTVTPDYVAEFACIGPACEDSCCRGWQEIGVDSEAKQLYELVSDPDLRERLRNKIETSNPARSSSPFRIVLNNDTSCPFWTEERLCQIQQNLGEQALCVTCKTYPRLQRETLGVVERTLTFSCPEAVRKALLRPEGIQFHATALETSAYPSSGILQWYHEPERSELRVQYLTVRRKCIELLQDRTRGLRERIERCEGELCSTDDRRTQPAESPGSTLLRRAKAQRLFLSMCCASPGLTPTANSRYEKLRAEIAPALAVTQLEPKALGGLGSRILDWRYARAARYVANTFIPKHGYMFENFLVAHIFRETLPDEQTLRNGDSVRAVFLYLAIVQAHLVALAMIRGSLTSDDVVFVVQSLAKQCEHRRVPLYDFLKLYRGEAQMNDTAISQVIL